MSEKDIYIKVKLNPNSTAKDLKQAVEALKKIGVISETATLVNKIKK